MGDQTRVSDPRTLPAAVEAHAPDWFRISNAGTRKAIVDIYDTIGWDTTAKDFVAQLRSLDVDEIDLHLNSPGGDVWDGMAILNALRGHPARVVATVDGVAASAASFIAMAGDEIVMARNSEMMIHDAAGLAVGNSETMKDLAARLDKVSDNIASVYAERAGGTVEDWRTAMRAETWYSAQEAVDAGLADRVAAKPNPEAAAVKNHFDFSIFNYAGRQAAPPPVTPSVTARDKTPAPVVEDSTEPPTREGAVGMPDAAKLREALGLKADASDQEVTAAFAAAGLTAKAADPPPQPTVTPAAEPPPVVAPNAGTTKATGDAVLIDPAQLKELQRLAARGDEAFRQLREKECDQVLDDAIKVGKFPPARREHWKALWAEDPDGTKETIDRLRAGTIPVSVSGYVGVGDETEQDMLYRQVYPERFAGQGT